MTNLQKDSLMILLSICVAIKKDKLVEKGKIPSWFTSNDFHFLVKKSVKYFIKTKQIENKIFGIKKLKIIYFENRNNRN